jgi:hypothetical protein
VGALEIDSMSKSEEQSEELKNLIYEIRTQTGLIVLLMIFNLATAGFCAAAYWYMMNK